MRKVTITNIYEVYKFDELDEDIQEQLIEDESKEQKDFEIEMILDEVMQEQASQLVEEYFGKGAKFNKTYYDLSYCQGDGAMIEFEIDLHELNKTYQLLNEDEIDEIEKVDDINIKVEHSNGHYYHERSFTRTNEHLTCYIDEEDMKQSDIDDLQNRLDNMFKMFDDSIVEMNERLGKFGYSWIECEVDRDFILEQLDEKEYLANGQVFDKE